MSTPQLFLDITQVAEGDNDLSGWMPTLLSSTLENCRIEPIVLRNGRYYYALDFVCQQLKMPPFMRETQIDSRHQDIWLAIDPKGETCFEHIPLNIARRGRLALTKTLTAGQLLQSIEHWVKNGIDPSMLVQPLENQT
jgi:hypothetical protein